MLLQKSISDSICSIDRILSLSLSFNKKKINWITLKLKFLYIKGHDQQSEKTNRGMENIYANHICWKGLICRIKIKELLQNKTNNLIKNGQRT